MEMVEKQSVSSMGEDGMSQSPGPCNERFCSAGDESVGAGISGKFTLSLSRFSSALFLAGCSA